MAERDWIAQQTGRNPRSPDPSGGGFWWLCKLNDMAGLFLSMPSEGFMDLAYRAVGDLAKLEMESPWASATGRAVLAGPRHAARQAQARQRQRLKRIG